MKNKFLNLAIFVGYSFACFSVQAAEGSLSTFYTPHLSKIRSELKNKNFYKQCRTKLPQWQRAIAEKLHQPSPEKNGDTKSLIKASFETRVELHEHLKDYDVECKKLTQALFSQMREMEDFLGTEAYGQLAIADIDFTKVNAPVLDHKDYAPFHLNSKFPTFAFEDGDVLITKGISPISSTITTLTDHYSPFSHIAFVHVNPETKKAETIESYIGRGVQFFSMVEAMKNENARILVLRSKDKKLALTAATYMRGRILKAKADGTYIPYDYALNFNDNKTLSCEEVAYDSFKTASGGTFIIPEAPSLIKLSNIELQKRVGMKKGLMMMPADMEIDSRFEIVLDWTDYRIIRDSWRKDVMMRTVLENNESGRYDFPQTMGSMLVPYIWRTRNISWLWPTLAKFSGIPVDFTPDVPELSLSTIASLKEVEAVYLSSVQKFDNDYFKQKGVWAPKHVLYTHMNNVIEKDLKKSGEK